MKIHLPGPVMSAALLVSAGVLVGTLATRKGSSAKTGVVCDGAFADSLQLLTPRVRGIEQGPRSEYTYLVRSSAKYECPYFGPDSKLRRRRIEAVEHGTAFAYEVTGGESYLLTNEHVAVWPDVTDGAHKVDGVQDGCKRVEEKLRIVHDDHDTYEQGQIALVRIASDPQLDAAILKAGQALAAMPYRLGK